MSRLPSATRTARHERRRASAPPWRAPAQAASWLRSPPRQSSPAACDDHNAGTARGCYPRPLLRRHPPDLDDQSDTAAICRARRPARHRRADRVRDPRLDLPAAEHGRAAARLVGEDAPVRGARRVRDVLRAVRATCCTARSRARRCGSSEPVERRAATWCAARPGSCPPTTSRSLGTLALLALAGDVPGRRLVDAAQLPLFFLFGQNYSPDTLLKLNAATWTLAVEVVFYLMLPVIGLARAALVPRQRRPPGRCCSAALAVAGPGVELRRLRSPAGARSRPTRRRRVPALLRLRDAGRAAGRGAPRARQRRRSGRRQRGARRGRGRCPGRQRLVARERRPHDSRGDGGVRRLRRGGRLRRDHRLAGARHGHRRALDGMRARSPGWARSRTASTCGTSRCSCARAALGLLPAGIAARAWWCCRSRSRSARRAGTWSSGRSCAARRAAADAAGRRPAAGEAALPQPGPHDRVRESQPVADHGRLLRVAVQPLRRR